MIDREYDIVERAERQRQLRACPPEPLSSAVAEVVWQHFVQSLLTGFQLATAAGPLAEEAMYGLCFVVCRIDLVCEGCVGVGLDGSLDGTRAVAVTSEGAASAAASAVGSGHLLSRATRIACRVALLSSPQARLVEGFVHCDLQCEQQQLGNLYALLSKRRGVVLAEQLVEGTELFLIAALLPVVESLGFSTQLLGKTSGAATAPQLSFSHWGCVSIDPFWRPTTEDERDEHGEAHHSYDNNRTTNLARRLIDQVRRRKGLMVEEKIVVAAEKQRTLTRSK